ncbi:MAG: Type 1 glutamine amidotransferase-like domain-containing protein [Clostridia bacterium]|nr:Type 1 glutamine amidotransferase-like domain-containing protein [Clostridia bacterium]
MKKGRIVAMGGGGFDDGEMMPVLERIVAMTEKAAPKVISLPTASFDHLDGEEELETIFKGLGCSSFETITLSNTQLTREEVRAKLLGADIVFVGGGNLEFLMNTWNATGATEALREAFAQGIVLAGVSSGAMCWFDEGYDDCRGDEQFLFVDCVGLLPYCNCPHFESEYWQSVIPALRERDSRPYSCIGCENGAALVYCDGKYEAVHGNGGRGKVWFMDKDNDFALSEVDASKL